MKRSLLLGLLAGVLLGGCASSSDLPAEKDKQLRENFSRTMSDDEVAKLKGQAQGSPPAESPAGSQTD